MTAPRREPRLVAGLIYPTGSIYVTNRTGLSNVPGNVIEGVLLEVSTTSQSIRPDERRTTIGTLELTALDLDEAVTDELRDQLLNEDRGIRGREVRLFSGDTDDFTDYQRTDTYVVDDVERRGRSYVFHCADRNREQRKDIFDRQTTRLYESIDDSQDTLPVVSTSGFEMLEHGGAFTHGPGETWGYVRIRKTGEIIGYQTIVSGEFQDCERGLFGTRPQALEFMESDDDKKPEIEEIPYLEMNAVQLVYAVLTGQVLNNLITNGADPTGTVGSQADGWTLTAGNDLEVAEDFRFRGPRSFKIDNSGGAADSRSYQDFDVVAGDEYLLSGRIRTDALPSSDAGFGAVLNVNIISGVSGFTIAEKVTIGADPNSSGADCGIEADDAAHDWTLVYCRFTPNGSDGTLRLFLQLGYGGSQSGTAWFDDIRVRKIIELPSGWHMGIDEDNVAADAFRSIGKDLYDPEDDAAGLILRFLYLEKTDGKRFLEEQVHVPLGTFCPIDNYGRLGLKRLVPMVSAAAPVLELGPSNVIEFSGFQYAQQRLINQMVIAWNHDGEEFTRQSVLLNLDSISRHGAAPPIRLELRGLHVTRHARQTLKRIFDYYADRYGAPPIIGKARLSRKLNALEVGDAVRGVMAHLPDYTDADTLDRTMEIQGRRFNPATGALEVDLFASTARTIPDPGAGTGAVIDDDWYDSEGTELSTVLTMSGDSVTADGDLPAGIYYYLGDFTIDAGVTVTFNGHVELRLRGDPTINGKLDGAGRGIAPLADPNEVSSVQAQLPNANAGGGFLGATRGNGGVYYSGTIYVPTPHPQLGYVGLVGDVPALPRFALEIDASGNLLGLPSTLEGCPGIYGAPVTDGSPGAGPAIVTALGGAGGAGGAGLVMVCRGTPVFGIAGEIDTSGADGSVPSSSSTLGGTEIYPGGGGGGAPGGCLIVLDGDDVAYPDVSTVFVADHGDTPVTGTPGDDAGEIGPQLYFAESPACGYADGLGSLDMFDAALLIQYAPSEVPGETEDDLVPAPTSLVAEGTAAGARLSWTIPSVDWDFVEIWTSIDNDRSNALLADQTRGYSTTLQSAVQKTEYVWIRARHWKNGASAWYPLSSTAGIAITYGGVLLSAEVMIDTFEYADADALHERWTHYNGGLPDAQISELTDLSGVPAGTAMRFGDLSGDDMAWLYRSDRLLPYDGVSLYEVGILVRMTAGSNGTFYAGVEGLDADGVTMINRTGADSHSSQYYFAAGADTPGTTLEVFRGYFRGFSGSPSSGTKPDPLSPGAMYTGVSFIRPMLILNYNGADGQIDIAFMWLRRVQGSVGALDEVDTDAVAAGAVTDVYVDTDSGTTLHTSGGEDTILSVSGDALDADSALYAYVEFQVNRSGTDPTSCYYRLNLTWSGGSQVISKLWTGGSDGFQDQVIAFNGLLDDLPAGEAWQIDVTVESDVSNDFYTTDPTLIAEVVKR